jgi:excisionase family DNA binding protein
MGSVVEMTTEVTMDDRFLTVAEAADRLTVCEEVVRRWLRWGKLRGTRLSRRAGWRIAASEVARLLQGERSEDRTA